MKLTPTKISGVSVIEPHVFKDARGKFVEHYNRVKLAALGIHDTIHLINHSSSQKGVLRGLHFQYAPKGISKLVRCTRGRLFDVAVDIRPDSPTFKQWFGIELSEENDKMLYVPAGCAHGFYSLTDCEILYATGENYELAYDANVLWNDPAFGIEWPLDGEPTVSKRDTEAPMLSEILEKLKARV